jgi:ubiquinol-cytochrome c reductase iron-sulfur subunit
MPEERPEDAALDGLPVADGAPAVEPGSGLTSPHAHGHTPASIETLSLDAPQFRGGAKHPERSEKVIAVAFLVALLAFAGFGAAYWQNANSQVMAATIGIGMVAVGYGLAAWGKYLMPRGPFVEERHRMVATAAERQRIIGDFSSRGKIAIERRGFLAKLMGAAMGVFGIVAAFPLIRSLGPLPKQTLYQTKWKAGSVLTTVDGQPVTVDFIEQGGKLTVFPEDDVGSAISQTVLLRPTLGDPPLVTQPGRESWCPQGFVAYSQVCTHAGCPVALYQERTQQLLCPCHQSLFDVLNGAEPVFGPAPRPLPQLPLMIDAHGFIRAQAGFDEPIGPGFWERDSD